MAFLAARAPAYNNDGHVVGAYFREGDRAVLEKTGLSYAEHHVERPAGWATDVEHLDNLMKLVDEPRNALVRLVLTDGSRLWASVATFEEHGFAIDRGHGKQRLLVDKWWTKGEGVQGSLL